ncbi:MAG: hypothetical protein IPN18_21325 [Ignavibacteriales bacterium]|nr:hypothetical protein [Ignavibacteriales bacterium]
MLKHYNHIIWDWNGTLFNDVHICLDIINNILEKTATNDFHLIDTGEFLLFP